MTNIEMMLLCIIYSSRFLALRGERAASRDARAGRAVGRAVRSRPTHVCYRQVSTFTFCDDGATRILTMHSVYV